MAGPDLMSGLNLLDCCEEDRDYRRMDEVRKYWEAELREKSYYSNSASAQKDLHSILEILDMLDEIHEYIKDIKSGTMDEMLLKGAEPILKMLGLLKGDTVRVLPSDSVEYIASTTGDTTTPPQCHVIQHGDRSVAIDKNFGTIIIN